jgi:hypothetical protein
MSRRLPCLGIGVVASALQGTACDEHCDAVAKKGISGQIDVAATHVLANDATPISIHGKGTDHIGVFSIDGGAGNVSISGRTGGAFTYGTSQFPDSSELIYQTLVVADDRLSMLWFYCDGEKLATIYREGTDGEPSGFEDATGTCVKVPAATVEVTFPALSMPYPALSEAYRMSGPAIQYDGANPGTFQFGPHSFILLPFASVDCSDCENPGWQEMHSLLWDPSRQELCVDVVYMFDQGHVTPSQGRCLPTLGAVADGVTPLQANWTICE